MIYFDGHPVARLIPNGLMLTDGARMEGIQSWELLTDDEGGAQILAARLEVIRQERNRLLAESDWTQMPDNALNQVQRAAWQAYRQSLRDLPTIIDCTNQQCPPWPQPPGENTR
jgi:hypothetical protein